MAALRSLDTTITTPPSLDEPATAEPALCALLQTLRVDRAAVALSPTGLDVALAHLVSLDAARAVAARRSGRRGGPPPPSGGNLGQRSRPSVPGVRATYK